MIARRLTPDPARWVRGALALLGIALLVSALIACGGPLAAGGATCGPPVGHPPDDTATQASRVIRTYPTSDGRTATLPYGRGTGRAGDYGWAHIRNKHVYGVWLEGGPLTRFGEVGVCGERETQDAIGAALQTVRPTKQGDRAVYRAPLPDGRGTVLVVVGGDGTIITAYPVLP